MPDHLVGPISSRTSRSPKTLDANQTHAVLHASKTEWYIEGSYWLAKILGKVCALITQLAYSIYCYT